MDSRDAIDFGREPVGQLFKKMFLPTLIAMVSMVVLNITDGAFIGHGVGSDALAAVNIISPLFMVSGGIGMMFGIGGSVVASIHLSHGKVKAANINITQSLIGAAFISLLLSVVLLTHLRETCLLFGASDALVPLASSYMVWIAALMPLIVISGVGVFIMRLDGSPKLAMCFEVGSVILNVIGDWLLIFPMKMGIAGAAMATSISFALSGVATAVYLLFFSKTLHIYKLKLSVKSFMLTLRNLIYQIRLGGSAFLGEVAISFVIIVGNCQFMRYLGEDGVAAYSVGCYLLPIAFMFGNAIVQSAQPIISFAYGAGDRKRIFQAMRVALLCAVLTGMLGYAFIALGDNWVSTTFLPAGCPAWHLCRAGLPLFGISFLFVILNLVLIGYYQSTERALPATVFTFLRGLIFMLPAFLLIPEFYGIKGLWLAQAVSEMATLSCVSVVILWHRRSNLHRSFKSV